MSDGEEPREVANPAAATSPKAAAGDDGATASDDAADAHLSSDAPSFLWLMRTAIHVNLVPENISPTHRFLVLQGTAYAGAGLLFVFLPKAGAFLLTMGQLATDDCQEDSSAGGPAVCSPGWREEDAAVDCMCEKERVMLQLAGFAVFMVGYFFIQMSRGNSLHFVAASTFNRVVLVPLTMGILFLLGARGSLCLLFAVMDPFLTLLTVLSLNGSKLLPAVFRRTDQPFRGPSHTGYSADPDAPPEEAPGFVGLLKIAIGAAEASTDITPVHRFIVLQGALYFTLGLLAFLVPRAGILVFTFGGVSADDMTGKELSMFRMVGGAMLFIGYYYAQSARAPPLLPPPPATLPMRFCSTSWKLCANSFTRLFAGNSRLTKS